MAPPRATTSLRNEDDPRDPSRFRRKGRSTAAEVRYRVDMDRYFSGSIGTVFERLENFPKYVPRQTLGRYLALYEIFKSVLDVQGDVIECGVHWGGGLMLFAQLSAVLEPTNLQRRIVGFDTFSGFPSVSAADARAAHDNDQIRQGGYAADSYGDLEECIRLYDANRHVGHLEKVTLVRGDARETIPRYLEQDPHTVVSLLHLDFDLYEPTKVALAHFVDRMPKGGIIVFDELNNAAWPGETVAVAETLGLSNLRIRRFSFEPHISYAVLE